MNVGTLLIAVVIAFSEFRFIKHASEDHEVLFGNPKIREVEVARNGTTPKEEIEPILRVYTNSTGGIVACMIPNACIKHEDIDQVLYVPNLLKAHSKLLKSCVQSNFPVEYLNSDSQSMKEPLEQLHVDVDVLGLPFIDSSFKHFAHFGPKVIAFSMLPLSLFTSKTRSITSHCVYPDHDLTRCETGDQWPMKPRLVVAEKVLHNNKGVWNRDFALMLSSNSTYLHVLPLDDKEQSPLTCFRSAITSPLKYDGSVELHDRLFREKGILRDLEKKMVCTPHIVVLFRDPGRREHRTFPDETMKNIEKQLLEDSKKVGISASFETIIELGSGRQLDEQIKVFQKADILVTAHGAELSNGFALRNGTRLVEISPFGFYDDWFHKTIVASGGQRKKICAPPDRITLKDCVSDRMRKRGVDTRKLDHSRAMKEFDELSRSCKWGQENPVCQLREEDNRKCVRKQRLLIDAAQLSEVIIDQILSFCEVS